MAMLGIEAFSVAQLQNISAFLTVCESVSVVDIPTMRQQIDQELHKHRARAAKVKRSMAVERSHRKKCPSCHKGYLVGPYNIDDLLVVRCSQKCGFSKVIS